MATIKEHLDAKRFFLENPNARAKLNWVTSVNAEEYRRWFLKCLNKKINRNEPKRGRKDDPDWFRAMLHTAGKINHPRLIIDWLPIELYSLFYHRLRCNIM